MCEHFFLRCFSNSTPQTHFFPLRLRFIFGLPLVSVRLVLNLKLIIMKKTLRNLSIIASFAISGSLSAQSLCYTPVVDGSGMPTVSGSGAPVITGETWNCYESKVQVVEVYYIYDFTPMETVDANSKEKITKAAETTLFEYDKAEIRKSEQGSLDDLAMAMKKNQGYNLVIEGHADSTGSKPYNYELGKERAVNVFHYLADKGVNPKRLKVRSYGENRPQSINAAYNRRVEFFVTK